MLNEPRSNWAARSPFIRSNEFLLVTKNAYLQLFLSSAYSCYFCTSIIDFYCYFLLLSFYFQISNNWDHFISNFWKIAKKALKLHIYRPVFFSKKESFLLLGLISNLKLYVLIKIMKDFSASSKWKRYAIPFQFVLPCETWFVPVFFHIFYNHSFYSRIYNKIISLLLLAWGYACYHPQP